MIWPNHRFDRLEPRLGTRKTVEMCRERVIGAPPERIWPLVDSIKHHREWDERVLGGHSLDEADEPVVGRRERLYERYGRREAETDLVVVDHERGGLITWRIEERRPNRRGEPEGLHRSVVLEPEDGRTRVKLVTWHCRPGRAAALAGWLGRRRERRALERALDGLERASAG